MIAPNHRSSKVSKVQTQKNRGNSKTKNNPTKNASQKNKACFKCGGKLHENRDDCKANGKTCSECGKEGHFARARDGSALCFALRKKSSQGSSSNISKTKSSTRVKQVEAESGSDQEDARWVEVECSAKQVVEDCLLYTSPSPRDLSTSRMPSSA